MAAGKGSRMRELTISTPKPLLEVHSKSFLEYNLEGLFPLVDEFVIVVNYHADQIIAKFGDSFTFGGQKKPIKYAFMQSPTNGTLDAFRCGVYNGSKEADSKFEQNNNYIVTNADHILQNSYYQTLSQQIQDNPDQVCLMTNKLEDKTLAKNYGVVIVDQNSNYEQIIEKPPEFISDLISIGLYYLPSFALNYFPQIRLENYIGEEGMPSLINNLAKEHDVKVLSSKDEYLTASTPEDLKRLNK